MAISKSSSPSQKNGTVSAGHHVARLTNQRHGSVQGSKLYHQSTDQRDKECDQLWEAVNELNDEVANLRRQLGIEQRFALTVAAENIDLAEQLEAMSGRDVSTEAMPVESYSDQLIKEMRNRIDVLNKITKRNPEIGTKSRGFLNHTVIMIKGAINVLSSFKGDAEQLCEAVVQGKNITRKLVMSALTEFGCTQEDANLLYDHFAYWLRAGKEIDSPSYHSFTVEDKGVERRFHTLNFECDPASSVNFAMIMSLLDGYWSINQAIPVIQFASDKPCHIPDTCDSLQDMVAENSRRLLRQMQDQGTVAETAGLWDAVKVSGPASRIIESSQVDQVQQSGVTQLKTYTNLACSLNCPISELFRSVA